MRVKLINNPKNIFDFANYLADEAAIISRKYFRQPLIIDNKSNATPVTIADKEIELRIRQLIQEHYPTHGIIGEEFDSIKGSCEFSWVIDPIDGTVAFSCGKPSFTTLIALLQNGEPIYSLVDQSISEERFCGSGKLGARLNNQPIHTSQTRQLAGVRLNATTPYMFRTEAEQALFAKLKAQVKLASFGGDAYAFALLAAGHIDVIMEADLQYYDVAALIPLIEGAGGIISDWQGKTLTPNFNGQCLASANAELHQQVLRLINN